jgi:thiol-disulfide isomerase/thioredoxin
VNCTRLSAILFCALACTALCHAAPRFSLITLDGEFFSNSSLEGRPVLLQFWATWCPHCRRDQAAVDAIERRYSAAGLIVLAINVGESEETVRAYLQRSPRACRVVASNGAALAAQFGAQGFPYYVLISPRGNVAGRQPGAGGEALLTNLLRNGGVSPGASGNSYARTSTAPVPGSGTVKIIQVPGARRTPVQGGWPPKPGVKAIFIFTNGSRLEADQYTFDTASVAVVVGTQHRIIKFTELDMNSTLAANHERGLDLKIPERENEVFVNF